jgi:HK97 family phage major capsid protein
MPMVAETIRSKVFDISPLARLARRVAVGGTDAWEEPQSRNNIGSGWVGETAARPETTAPTFEKLRIPLHEVYAAVHATAKLLDTSGLDLGLWLEGRIADRFARLEGAAFVAGTGVGQPRGLTDYPTSTLDDDARDWNTIQYTASGAAGAFAASNAADKLIDLAYSLRAPYRPNARWLMSRTTAGVIRSMKSGSGDYLWRDGLAAGQPPVLLGFPVELDEEMPAIAANSLSVAFGDLEQAYTIVEQAGMKMLRDPFSSKPSVIFYAYKRVGGGLANGEAVKVLQFSAS